jgi:hypothetical protein
MGVHTAEWTASFAAQQQPPSLSAVLFYAYKETSLYLKIQFLSNIKYTPYLLHKVAKTVERNNWF